MLLKMDNLDREFITDQILNVIASKTIVTKKQLYKLYVVIGPNWNKLIDATEMVRRGNGFDNVFEKATLGEI